MPKKKAVKKKKKSKKTKEKGDDDDEEKCPIEIPPYQDPDEYAPKARLKITLAAPISTKLQFVEEV